MSYPFIIWTFQRTGGTTLSAALSNAFLEQGIKHEPFNLEREFGSITRTINSNKHKQGSELLDQVLNTGVSIKHCFELHSNKFNTLFLQRLAAHGGYRHIILMREAEAERLCSLFLARQTAVWGKWKADKGGYNEFLKGNVKLEPFPIDEMLEHSKNCLAKKKWLIQMLRQMELPCHEVTYEEIYSGPTVSQIQVTKDIFGFVGARYEESEKEVRDWFSSGGQKSERLFTSIPNFNQAWEALTKNT